MKIRLLALLTLLIAVLIPAHADGLVGKWTAEFDTQIGPQKYTYEFKQEGDKVTGQATYAHSLGQGTVALRAIKVEGDKVSFTETFAVDGNEVLISYRGVVDGDEIKLTRDVGDVATEQLTAKRVVAEFTPEAGFLLLFNAKDLTGWCFREGDKANLAIVERFDGKVATPDERYSASGGALVVHPHTPRKIQKIFTQQEFPKNFILRLEFRAAVNADSGIYLRGPQLQCRDYLVAGPYKTLTKYRPQDWNEIEVVVTDGVARCTCNGEVLEEALKLPATGPIGLEGDRDQMEYRHIRLKELP
ncbi:MAG TPA: DUF1080 domain-containing protein [Lacunisphaera sp.]|nr:DUF1080 domain-containing protein [Lacunisphaera sp.]